MSRPRSESTQDAPSTARTLMAVCAGNAVEWYDFAIYGALGVIMAPLFIPTEDSATILLAAFALYATAFLV